MNILAIETATETCSAALLVDGEVLERFEHAPRQQTGLILPMVNELLAESGLRLGAMDAIAFGRGPGAFTGVRVATSVAQGLAMGCDRPVVPVSTLASAALAALDTHADWPDVLVAFDARMGELYLGAYARHAGDLLETVLPDCLARPDSVPALPRKRWHLAGSGVVHQEVLAAHLDIQRRDAEIYPRAGTVARLAVAPLKNGDAVSADQALPVYLRDQVTQGAVR